MGRLSPTVLPDSGRRGRPGLEIAEAFGLARKQKLEGEDRVIAGETRDRERAREDIDDAGRQVEFERFIKDELGGTPTPRPQQSQQGSGPDVAGPAFDAARQEIGAGADLAGQGGQGPGSLTDPQDEGEIIALPGQFMGGQFVPETVRTPTPTQRTLAGQTFDIDPSQTAAARSTRAGQQGFKDDLEALVAAGIPRATAEAQLRSSPDAIKSFLERQPERRPDKLDPMKNEFGSDAERDAFINFRRRLSEAEDRPTGARPEDGPISVKDALAELDNIYGEFDRSGNLVGSSLTPEQRFDLADRWSKGLLKSSDLPPVDEPEPTPDEDDSGPGFFGGLINMINPRVDRLGNPTPAITPGPTANGSLTSEASIAPRAQVPVLQDSTQPGRVEPGPVDASQADSISSIRAIIETRPDITPERIKEILVEQGFNPALIDAAIGRR